MAISTYSEFQAQPSSRKVGLVIMEASKRVTGFSVYSGSVYRVGSFDFAKIVSLSERGVALTEVTSVGAVTAGTFYNDRTNHCLYVQTASSGHPNGRFLAMTFRLYFADADVHAPHDLSTGFEVHWLPYLAGTSDFGVELDNQQQLGVAIEGSGTLTFNNDQGYWKPIYDKYYFENQRVFVYSWGPGLPITEAKIIYRGRVQSKSYEPMQVKFTLKDFLNELRAPVGMEVLGDYAGARVPDNLANAFQRRVYGYVYGHRPANIDQVLDGYPLTGTVTTSPGAVIVIGAGTSFLSQVAPGDELTLLGDTDSVTVESVTSDTTLTISSGYTGQYKSAVTATVTPDIPKDYANRVFLLAGHPLTAPTALITACEAFNYFDVDDATDFRAGDAITVGSALSSILRISGTRVFLSIVLTSIPAVGTVVTRDSVSNVQINDRLLTKTRDYSYDAAAGTLTLNRLAEFNVAPILKMTGVITVNLSGTAVAGVGTFFKTELQPGDWLKASGQTAYSQVLSVESDTAATLRAGSPYGAISSAAYMRRPDVYKEGEHVLSCDVIGLSDTGLATGQLLYKGPDIVRDLLERAGLTASLDDTTFTAASLISQERIGVAIPERFDQTQAPSIRDVINAVNKSVFGSLIQTSEFNLAYSVLDPRRSSTITSLDESDIIKFSIRSNSDKIVGTSYVEYLNKEYDAVSAGPAFQVVSKTSDAATYLAGSSKEYRTTSLLVDESAAQIMANRWAFIFEVSSSVLSIDSKLQLARVQVGDRIEVSHEKLYERVGSSVTRKVAGVQVSRRSITDSSVELEDLSNAFSRCGIITADTASAYSAATATERTYNGYITDDYGLMANDPETLGVNLIY